MTRPASGNFARNCTILAIVAALHLLVVYALSRIRSASVIDPEQVHTTWIVIADSELKRNPLKKRSTRATRTGQIIEESSRSLPITDSSLNIAIQPSTDWHADGAKSARDVAMRRANESVIGAIAPDPVFSTPVHKNGDSEHFDDGEIATWIDSRCYATNKDFGEQRANANSVSLVCKGNVGKPPIRRDMFDHLKPAYLRVPQPKTDNADPKEMSQETH